jgi:hypothetical protein
VETYPKATTFPRISTCVLGNYWYIFVTGVKAMKQFRKGQTVWALVQGEHRALIVDSVTSDGTVAQCYWTDGRNREFVMVFAGAQQKEEGWAVPVRQHD